MYKEEKIKVPRFKEENGFYTTSKRSKTMSRIQSSDTKPEVLLRKALWHRGIRYRKNYKQLPGKPDIYISKYNLVVFIDGEFWHGYNWEDKRERIKRNRGFWIPKIERNMQRDLENNAKLKELGFYVLRFWSNDVKNDLNSTLKKIMLAINASLKP